ncbi:alkylation response protein AidB-like acyl-CoA dehydrogenase [Nocardioides ginsengisegetis]|uniref:Alkylation response protein AidB-like acyl-CoA dehydrogenase n=1 Tax=Nocardioides ginsengisegetis TaxID=661491 RepID=A0A7W3PAM6_9ACTN|nr:acyl-CoA dehydrogenase family protein [Nocardioides ginsengisegetis]MBA8804915.1 alkylation response protein AidB-like acyl-CoA dehydrogenase [Nocardioides ginsengisegetis]
MDLALRSEDEELVAAFDALLTKKSSTARVREVEALGFDPDLWSALTAAGVPSMAAGEHSADLRQLILIAELAGRHLVSAPLVETLVTRRLLAHCEGSAAAGIAAQAENGSIVSLVLRPVTAASNTSLVPAGAVADVVVAMVDERLIAVVSPSPGVASPNLGSQPLADRDLGAGETVTLATGADAAAIFAAAQRDWQLLTAAQLVGVAAQSLEIGVEYVKNRVIFDQPVGAFQTVAHRLADHVASIEGARLLVQQAAWSADNDRLDSVAHTKMAFCFAADQALAVVGDCLHYHGGYGFSLEYDIQLYYRRARAYPLVWGSVRREYQALAAVLYDEAPVRPVASLQHRGDGIDFDLGPEAEAFRAEVAAFLDEHLTLEIQHRVRQSGSYHDWDLHRALGEKGWIAASWPAEYGGQDRDPLELMAMREEMKKVHAPVNGLGTTLLVARAVREFGCEELRNDIVPRAIAGEILLCLGYSEPQGGSDVASARTRAVRDGEDWVINGQKVFTTLAETADYVFLLTRTNTEVAKHQGLTMFLVPLDAAGVQVDEIRTLSGERTNQTFYADVRIPDTNRVGEVDGGWQVLMAALAYERSGVGEDPRTYRRLVEAVTANGTLDDPVVREPLARLAIDTEVSKLLGRRSCWVETSGRIPTMEGSMHKLFHAESRIRSSTILLDLLGTEGLREEIDPLAPGGGELVQEFRHAVILSIYGGASEVQRRILAERHLGLPQPIQKKDRRD